MSIIIKGMDMPISCAECRFCCPIYDKATIVGEICTFSGRQDNQNCPLVEIPTPHGRLIEEHYHGELKAKQAEGLFVIYRSADEDADRFILEEEK